MMTEWTMDQGGRLIDVDGLPAPATLAVPVAGQIIGVGRNQAYEAARRGELPTVRFGGRVLVPTAALERLLRGEKSVSAPGVV